MRGSYLSFATTDGDPTDTLDYVILSIRYFYDSGSFFLLPQALAACTLLLDRLAHFEPAAVSGFAATTYTLSIVPEMDVATAHLRDAVGDQAYLSLAHAFPDRTSCPELPLPRHSITRSERAR